MEDHLGIQIGNINLNRLHFPSTFSETKSKIQQATYQQLQIKVDNETKLQKQENERKLIQVASESESIKITTLANAEKEKVIIGAKAQAEELRILNEAIEKYPQAYQLKLLGISSDAWKTVGSSSSTKIIIPEGEKNGMKPLDFISQMVVTKEILDDKKLIEDKKN